jgi:S1-C subfamily serine protease
MRASLLLLALLAGCGGCASVPEVPSHDELRALSLRLEWPETVCTGTPVAADVIRTAAHCLAGGLLIVNGTAVAVVGVKPITTDVVDLTIAGQRFDRWAVQGPALKQGDRVRWWGNPMGEPDVYREGYVSKVGREAVFIDATICRGDSGSGIFNAAGQLVGVVSMMTDAAGCTFMVSFN